jgi:hypothetical protein
VEAFFSVKSAGKRSGPVGAVMFNLRSGLKAEWIDSDLPDNNAGLEIGVVLHCGPNSRSSAANLPQASEN